MAVILTSSSAAYAILKPVISAPRLDKLWLAEDTADFLAFVSDIPAGEYVALDTEYGGGEQHEEGFRVVTLGLSCSIGSISIDLRDMDRDQISNLFGKVAHLQLIGHSLLADGAVLHKYGQLFDETNWCFDTYGLYCQLANEGFNGQKWGVKAAMTDQLGWTETNEEGIDLWLVENGHTIPNTDKLTNAQRLEGYNCFTKTGGRKIRPDKSQMYRVPHEILGRYNAMDCDATWQLFTLVLKPALDTVPPALAGYHQRDFLNEVSILIEWQQYGVAIDKQKVVSYNSELKDRIRAKKLEIRNHPEVLPHIQQYEADQYPEKAPEQYTKKGTENKNYIKWRQKQEIIEYFKETGDILAKDGFNSEDIVKKNCFNLASGSQIGWLIYEKLFKWEVIRDHIDADSPGAIRLTHNGAELTMTDSGQFPTDGVALEQMGEIGKLLNELSGLNKEQGYVQACIDKLHTDGRLYLYSKCPGTITGRLAGDKGLNYQQLPKSWEYLECWVPDAGWAMVDCDHSALEPVVLAELSRDPNYLKIYGPDAKPGNCVYLFIGWALPGIGDAIRNAGYDRETFTPEIVNKVKKECKEERGISKKYHLSATYSAGPNKIYSDLILQGVKITRAQVEEGYAAYWSEDGFAGVKRFEEQLKKEWRENRGFIINGVGRPVCAAEKKVKDLINSVCQSTGHDAHMKWLFYIKQIRTEWGLNFRWYVPDFHDQTILVCPKNEVEKTKEMFIEAYRRLNEELGGLIPLTGKPEHVENLAHAKTENYLEKRKEKYGQ